MIAKSYPRKIEGDLMDDDILSMNPELKLFDEVVRLKKEVKSKEKVRKILWAYAHTIDPRSFYSLTKTVDQIKAILEKNYLGDWWDPEKDWEKYSYIDEWYRREVIVNDSVKYYISAKESLERMIKSGDIKPLQIKQQKDVIQEFKEEAYGIINEAKDYYELQGARQPGLGARTPKR